MCEFNYKFRLSDLRETFRISQYLVKNENVTHLGGLPHEGLVNHVNFKLHLSGH